MDDTRTLLRLIDGKSNVRVELGYYRALEYPRVIVDVGGGRIPAETATDYRPEINEQVQILFIDGKPWMLGPAVPKPGEGVIVTIAGDIANVQTDIGVIQAPFPHDAGLTSGNQVKLYWSQGPYILSRMSTSPEPPVDPGAGGGGAAARQTVFTATRSGAWQVSGGRWSSDEPRASNGYLGAWHYGTKIRDTIPGNATNPVIEVYIRYASKFGNAPNFALHNQASRGGAPSLFSEFAWNVSDGWNRVPSSVEGAWFDSLKGGGNALGIGLKQGGVNRFASVGADPLSGAIRISYNA
jgi:hypothetical protein